MLIINIRLRKNKKSRQRKLNREYIIVFRKIFFNTIRRILIILFSNLSQLI